MVVRNISALWFREQSFVFTWEDFYAGAMVAMECNLGFILLFLVMYGCYRIPSLKTPFGILMINQNGAQLLACINSGFFFYAGACFNFKPIVTHSYIFGNLSIFLLPVILGSFMLMSLNRVCAATLPFQYHRIFGPRMLKIYIIGNWLIPVIPTIYVLFFRECNFIFYHYGWLFTSAPWTETCGSVLLLYAAFIQIILSALILGADLTTLVFLMFFRNKIYQSHNAETRRREFNFAGQVLLQGVVFLVHGFWYDLGYNVLPGNSEKWKTFFTTSFSSNLLHVFDPIIVFAFNREFRRWIIPRKKSSVTPQHKVTVVSSIGPVV